MENLSSFIHRNHSQLTASHNLLRLNQLRTLLLHPHLFKDSLLKPSQGAPVSFQSFPMIYSHPTRGGPVFCLALGGWSKTTIFGKSVILHPHKVSYHLNPSLIIVLESEGKEPTLSYSLLLKYIQSNGFPKESVDK